MTWGGLEAIFNPGAGHFQEEIARKRIEARIPGNEGGPNTVDLEHGIVRITVARKQDAPLESPPDAPDVTPQDTRDHTPQDAVIWPSPQDAR